ncbi:hypothetical protein [Arthrobacter sp. Marseille-P9274]|uniref:hypothetical protein n=1 Tax=Arthrobacter sp. Marseille-P9274 TaxID=2866572 RepID=UPI0021CABE0A|nr:hypothetical protein [Arthrobacter sp. Marseille-P9274]
MISVKATAIKGRNGQVRSPPFSVDLFSVDRGVTPKRGAEILAIRAGDGAEGARFWLQVPPS